MESPSSGSDSRSIEDLAKKKEIYLLSFVKNPLIVLKKIVAGFFRVPLQVSAGLSSSPFSSCLSGLISVQGKPFFN